MTNAARQLHAAAATSGDRRIRGASQFRIAGYADPNSANAIGAALSWLQGTLLGSVATAAAIVAVASVGFLMLTGRIDFRRAAHVILGCFILFGADCFAPLSTEIRYCSAHFTQV